jgi:hypothetical protein
VIATSNFNQQENDLYPLTTPELTIQKELIHQILLTYGIQKNTFDQNTPHVEAPVDQTYNIIESENDNNLDDDNLTNQELYNLRLKMYRKTTKKQERKIKELETKIDNLTEYIM